MANIEVRDVSLKYTTEPQTVRFRMYEQRQDVNQEDLPRKSGSGVLALDHVNLSIPNGLTYVILGPSGCGKSSLLRVMAGLENNYSGSVEYDGVEIENIPPKERLIGMVFQNYALYPNFDNEGNLSFFFKINKIKDEITRERIKYTSDLMGIGFDELLQRRPRTLSGGQKQRVAIARAIVRNPRIFFLDEPLSNLDAKLRVQTRLEIKRLLQKFQITSVYVTHDQIEAIALADQIVIMRAGIIEQAGTYAQLMKDPINSFVAGFLGLPPMNLFPGAIISNGSLLLEENSINTSNPLFPNFPAALRMVIGARPEVIKLNQPAGQPGSVSFSARVENVEHDFSRRTKIIRLQKGSWVFSAICTDTQSIEMGENVTVQIDKSDLYYFDETTGLRI
ncbi:MAG: ATP-binding cassette domain-containing protein [Chloroflexota bacterium]